MHHSLDGNAIGSTVPVASDDSMFRKVAWRIVPFLFLCYVVSFLDRINIGFAQLQMKHDLGFSDAMYGLGAAVFYVGYVLCDQQQCGVKVQRPGDGVQCADSGIAHFAPLKIADRHIRQLRSPGELAL